ncbi:MAG TPA: SNF2-related protein [Polyangiaceae bacterium LLY-WYZ-15_(1-7)]|nr:SNF2-related protein [Polyangiaceae bacterium LLY-WYZ-15_(1-7)]HJL12138.1 SNF2-related protein [Polyangiaceae bacterium LLY-WYZ-15_(1-7)]HJL47648.1 SNF2-related protein [Polyangiaceae bacterium LLY-WYZ-15_(1-7)]
MAETATTTGSESGGGSKSKKNEGSGKKSGGNKPKPPIVQKVIEMSDRSIQRVTGANAFLRGRRYARRKSVDNLVARGGKVRGEIHVGSQDEAYETSVELKDDGAFVSKCTCPGWRGPDAHCKHVAAVLVALRDRERPPRPKKEENKAKGDGSDGNQGNQNNDGGGGKKKRKRRKKKNKNKPQPVHVPQTVSVGGKRRTRRRRRRGGGAGNEKLEVLSARDLAGSLGESRGAIDAWLPPDARRKPLELEFRVVVRPASLAVTPVVAGTRNAVPIADAIGAFNMISNADRAIMRALGRNTSRGNPATAELRAEDAAEALSLLKDKRVLLEPASMELRFSDETLRPSIELDTVSANTLRTRVVFVSDTTQRRFALSSGAWFEGTPGWHIDASDGVARPIDETVTPGWLQRLYRSPSLVHPIEEMPKLLGDHIPRIAATLKAELPDLSSIADLVDATPEFQLWGEGDIVEAHATLKVQYDDHTFPVPVEGFPTPLAFLPPVEKGGPPRVVRRDVGMEMAALQRLLDQGFEAEDGELIATGDDAIQFWSRGIGELPKDWERFVPDDLAGVKIRKEGVSTKMRVSSGVDWLSLDMVFGTGDAVVSEEELRACLESGRDIVRLSDGTYAPVDPDAVGEVLARMAEIYATAGGKKKLPLSQAGRIQDLIGLVGESDADVKPKARSLFEQLDDIDEVPSVAKPRSLKAKLRPYQKQGFSWLVFLHQKGMGGILADDMGLGKTLQTIALLLWAKSKHKRKLNLVIAPTSVVPNWEREIHKFAPSTFKAVVWQGPNRFDQRDALDDADVMITSYALLRRDEELLAELDFRYAILDEAQHIKNPASQTAQAAKKLQSEHRLALTGTPIENRLSEMWSIFDFVSPGLLGNLKKFEENVARPIDRGDQETADRLRNTIKPFVLRRLKTDVADDLPEKIEQEIVVPMEEAQDGLYKQVLAQVRKNVLSEVEKKGISKSQIQILAALTRLRQVACDPRLVKDFETADFSADDSGKLAALREIVENAKGGGHRVLIFSQFVTMLQHIRNALDEDGVSYEYLDGSTKDRLERVERFNEDESIQAFLISLKAGGTGLNLTGADTVIHFDPWWNPAVEDQATDRAHRIGQTKVVNVYRLIARGSVEEKILELSAKKRALMENVLSTEGSPLKGLTKKDVDALFS